MSINDGKNNWERRKSCAEAFSIINSSSAQDGGAYHPALWPVTVTSFQRQTGKVGRQRSCTEQTPDKVHGGMCSEDALPRWSSSPNLQPQGNHEKNIRRIATEGQPTKYLIKGKVTRNKESLRNPHGQEGPKETR